MFSPAVLDHTLNPRNVGKLEGATHEGVAGEPGEGPYIMLWFKVNGENIEDATYETFGCPAAVACGSLVAQLAKGKTISWVLSLEEKNLVTLLGGLPEGKEHNARLVIHAVRDAFEGGC